MPKKIIILRHGEKADGYRLCSTGAMRAAALASKYLGKHADASLFDSDGPAAILGITLHTLELIGPASASWGVPVTLYAALPDSDDARHEAELDARTKEAADAAMTNPAWADKTILMVWEHKRIASKELDPSVTLRHRLKLDELGDQVPKKWQGENYDYFWIVTYDAGVPVSFDSVKQTFGGPYADLPQNDWGEAVTLPPDCKA